MSEGKEKKIKMKGVVKQVYKEVGKAISDYNMLQENDRVLIAVSGGVDSLSLVELFQMRKRRVPVKFDFFLCSVLTDFIKIDRGRLENYFKEKKVDYVIKKLSLDENDLDCFWCSWSRRKVFFETARELGCNKLALGHNLDDIAETVLMNLCFTGEISTMKPKLDLFNGELTIIRPLCYTEKKELLEFAFKLALPVTDYKCLYGKDSKRRLIRNLINKIEEDCPYVKKNIFNSLKRIKQDYLV